MTSENRSATDRSATNHSATDKTSETSATESSSAPTGTTGITNPVEHPGDQLSALLDHELDPALAAQVNRHVDGCTACLAELTSLDRVRRTIRGMPPVPAPAGFMAQLVETRERADRRGLALVGVAACLVVAVGLVVADPPDRSVGDDVVPASAGQDDDLVRLEAHRAGNGNGGEELHPSVLDRANTAASDLLEFLTG